VALAACAAAVFGCVTAPAYASGPRWALTSVAAPRSFVPADSSGHDQLLLEAINVGNSKAEGSVTITDTLPAGLTAVSIAGEGAESTCTLTSLSCVFTEGPQPARRLAVVIHVDVQPSAPASVLNEAIVIGGSADEVTASDTVQITPTPVGFGIERSGLAATNEDGSADTQAGSHPYELMAEAGFNQALDSEAKITTAGSVDDLDFELPPGVIIDPQAVPHCTYTELATGDCPNAAAVGVAMVSSAGKISPASVYDLMAAPGQVAQLGFVVDDVPFLIDTDLSNSNAMTMHIDHITQAAPFAAIRLELWGVPGDSSHDAVRGTCLTDEKATCPSAAPPTAFLTLPTSCTEPSSQATLQGDSWQEPGVLLPGSIAMPALTGCEKLSFSPALAVLPSIDETSAPSGYEVDLRIPQTEDPFGLASSDPRNATITLPEGVGISLSFTNGLQTCSQAQVGLGSSTASICPNPSKIGLVTISTPFLTNPLEGAIYLAAPDENPFDSPLAVYVVAEEALTDVRIKLVGQLEPNPATGQLAIMFGALPQLPISEMRLQLFGGERALLSTPPACGLATSTGELTPWSGASAVTSSSAFEIDQGANGMSCSGSGLFSPTFQVGSTEMSESDVYGSLTLSLIRADQEEQFGAIAIQGPAALASMFTGVPTCEEPQASQGTCPAATEIGTVTAQAGLGYDSIDLNGEVYLTGPYDGAAQGLEIVLPVNPVPLQLGNALVRMTAQIEPGTGQLHIAGPLPSIVDGIPLQLKALQVQLDSEFHISPDGCEPLTVTGTISGAHSGSITTATEPWGVPASECPPQTAHAPATTTGKAVSTSILGISLTGKRFVATGHGEAAIELKCTSPSACHGKLTLTTKTEGKSKRRRSRQISIGTVIFSIPPGKVATVELKLNSIGRALLGADHGRLGVNLTIVKYSPSPSQTHTESVYLVQQKARRHAKK
jgi:hypothetical protein